MLAAGYTAISHGIRKDGTANGVLVVVRASYAGGWQNDERDEEGRGVAGTLVHDSGGMLRLIGVYAITGVSLPGFEAQDSRKRSEDKLIEFI